MNSAFNPSTRRELLIQAGGGLGALALAAMLDQQAAGQTPARQPDHQSVHGTSGSIPHFQPRAKSVIWLFMEGGPSHIDLFDPKPTLQKLAGQPLPSGFKRPITAMGTSSNGLMPSKRSFRQHGQSGLWVSDWYPKIAEHADDLCLLRSCWADGLNHVGSVCQMNTGSILAGRPSLGSWVQYGLGSLNDSLPSFVVLLDEKEPVGGVKNWSSGFLPGRYQGAQLNPEGAPILNLRPQTGISRDQQRAQIDLLQSMNQRYAAKHSDDLDLEARIRSFELAFKMQSEAPEAVEIGGESLATRALYGLDNPVTRKFGTNCLLARRLVERGVRFVELYCGTGSQWDAHADLEGNHSKMCAVSDVPVAGLLADLKARGLLDSTLVIWGGEFGRTPMSEGAKGRDHNPWGFSMFLAGGGSKPGVTIGATDEVGLRVADRPIHVHDLHATILHLMGMDHLRLTYRHDGRNERATVNAGSIVQEAVA